MKSLDFIRDIFRKYPLLLISSAVLVIFVSAIEACSLFTIGPLVDLLIHPNLQNISPLTEKIMKIAGSLGVPLKLNNYLILFIAFIILSSIIRILLRNWIVRAKFVVIRDIMIGTFKNFFNAKWYFFSSKKQGMLLNTFIRETENVGDAFAAMTNLAANFLQLALYLVIPFYLSWQVTSVSLAVALLLSVPFILIGRTSYKLGTIANSSRNEVSSVLQENFTLAKVVLGFANQKMAAENLFSSFEKRRKATIKASTIGFAIPILYRPIGAVVLAVAVFAAKYLGVPISETVIILFALLQAVIVVGNMATNKNLLDNTFPAYEQIKRLQEEAAKLRQKSGAETFKGFEKSISLTHVSFAYPGHKPVLEDVSMEIPKGKMIAIVGASGTGKSTLIDIIIGFNEPTRGRVSFDGVDLANIDINSYRKQIGYVPQDSVLFNMSIKDNLLWSKNDATYEEIKHASSQANAVEFIEKFPARYDTIVGDRGVRLSGGQCQRIALARAILRRPELLILDEATSSLDTASERLIQQAVESIAKETTVIIIAHRLSTIANADYIYVLKDGKIAENGTYQDLVKAGGSFDRMVKLQLLEAGK